MSDKTPKNFEIKKPPPPPKRVLATPPPIPKSAVPAKKSRAKRTPITWLMLICIWITALIGVVAYWYINHQNPSAKIKAKEDKIAALTAKLENAKNDGEAEAILEELEKETAALEEAKSKINSANMKRLILGKHYIVDDGETKIDVVFDDAHWVETKLLWGSEQKEFWITYSFKIIGPRGIQKDVLLPGSMMDRSKAELTLEDGRIFEGHQIDGIICDLTNGWKPKEAGDPGESGKWALNFKIPKNSVPKSLFVKAQDRPDIQLDLGKKAFATKVRDLTK